MIASLESILDILCCPKCHTSLNANHRARLICRNVECELSQAPFLEVRGQPVLIDFENSIVDRDELEASDCASASQRDDLADSLRFKIFNAFLGKNRVAGEIAANFSSDLKGRFQRPRVLVVGGGAIGAGIGKLYDDQHIELIGIDIYPSPNITVIADGHSIPLADKSVDGVWIQAVLEHVLDPHQVVSEIYRVLIPNGLVFADTPFMWQVHEGAYDFTRFTLSGHRWLFREFDLLDAGVSMGPTTATLLAIRYFVRSLCRNDKIATGVQMMFFWVRFLDRFCRGRQSADAAAGVFFYGKKSESSIEPADIIKFYQAQKKLKEKQITFAHRL
ncbi:MAG TPA: class I SAM-dependent methyltransferase [Stellaceae bacterium]|nr:class I SAM-dependent methyltransferase [Stellaceae bacterium]